MLARVGITNPWTCAWAIHPGGAAILAAFRAAFGALHITGAVGVSIHLSYSNYRYASTVFVLAPTPYLSRLLVTVARARCGAVGRATTRAGEGLSVSESVLSDNGNMSSATIFFVLQVRRFWLLHFRICRRHASHACF